MRFHSLLRRAGALLILALASATALAQNALPERITLFGGQVHVYKAPKEISRIAVGDGDLLAVETVERRELVLIGGAGKSGFTTLHLWYADGGQRAVNVQVMSGNAGEATAAIRNMLGAIPGAQVMEIGGNVVITGSDIGQHDAERIAAVQKLFPQVVNMTAADPVGMRPTVLMDVRIMEIENSALRELGIRWDDVVNGPAYGAIKDFSNNPYYRINPPDGPLANIPGLPNQLSGWQTYFGLASSITSRINLLKQTGKVYELAAPQLSARSGGAAEFLAGGEVPIPIPAAFGQTQIEYKPYGIKLNIEPVVNARNEVSASVETEVSSIDDSVVVNGAPGFKSRRAKTEINVRSGETIVISGLVDLAGSNVISRVPGLGDIPILGRLFRSDRFRADRSDLVILVTPRVVGVASPENVEAIDKSQRMEDAFKTEIGAPAMGRSLFD